MKIISIGDLHGSDCWKTIDIDNFDKVVFIGDYVDSFNYSDAEIIHNLKEIIDLKKLNQEKVILLWGNHDYMYWKYPANEVMCSGFRISYQYQLSELFINNYNLFQIAYSPNKNYLFTHAGVLSTWLSKYQKIVNNFRQVYDCKNTADFLNMLPYSRHSYILSDVGYKRGGYKIPSPLWADFSEIKNACPSNLHQIVGHTPIDQIETFNKNKNASVTCIDYVNKNNLIQFYNLEI